MCHAAEGIVAVPDWTELSSAAVADLVARGQLSAADFRAWQILGERFVATWQVTLPVDGDPERLVVGIWNLRDSEAEGFRVLLRPISHLEIEVENRSFSRAQLIELHKSVVSAFGAPGGWVGLYVRDYAGLVLVEALPACLDEARAALIHSTGLTPIEGSDADAIAAAVVPPQGGFAQAEIWGPTGEHPEVLLRGNRVNTPETGAGFNPGEGVISSDETVTDAADGPANQITVSNAMTKPVKPILKVSVKERIKASSRIKVKVTVRGSGINRPVGKLTISWGKGRKTVAIRGSDQGTVTVRLPSLPLGRYRLSVQFKSRGDLILDSSLKRFRFRVV
jgi:hypothetical protein